MRRLFGFLLGSIICLYLVVPPVQVFAKENVHILILNSYHPGFPWSDGIMEGMKSTLYDQLEYPEITIEYLDTKRHFSGMESELMDNYRAIFASKYGKDYFDVILVSDDNAYQFLLRYGEELFGKTPTVFCGVNNYNAEQLTGHENITGLVETPNNRETVELMLELHPRMEKIGFITDWTTSGRGNRGRLAELAEEMSGKAEFFFLDPGGGITVDELKRKVANLEKDTGIFYRDFFRDKNDTYLPPGNFIPELTSLSNVPIYSIGSFYLGLGIVGGKMDDASDHGRVAAEMAVDILDGKAVAEIPVLKKKLNKYMFDYEVIKRFNIKRSDLPADSIMINRPFSFYYEYTSLFWVSLAVFFLMLLLSAFLFITVQKRNLSNTKLEEAVGKLSATLDSIGDAVITTDTEGRITSVNPVAETLHGHNQHEMVGKPFPAVFPITVKEGTDKEERDKEGQDNEGRERSCNPALQAVREKKVLDLGMDTMLQKADGSTVPISTTAAPIRDRHNTIMGAIVVFRDRTREYTFRRSIERSLKEKTTLIQEIHHRVKNNLSIIVSLLNLQIDQYERDQDPVSVLLKFRDRVFSMALVHENLYKSESFSEIDMGPYIRTMIDNLLYLYGSEKQITMETDIADVSIDINRAVPIGLILNELLTNAFTHAFPQNRKGKITVSLVSDEIENYILTITDNGIGCSRPDPPKKGRSLGLKLVDLLASQIDAALTRESSTDDQVTGENIYREDRAGGNRIQETSDKANNAKENKVGTMYRLTIPVK